LAFLLNKLLLILFCVDLNSIGFSRQRSRFFRSGTISSVGRISEMSSDHQGGGDQAGVSGAIRILVD
jgi:hypothetical protein